jgi:hypothetical protein
MIVHDGVPTGVILFLSPGWGKVRIGVISCT